MEESEFIYHTNKKWFWSHLESENEVNEVCEYLEDNNLKIELKGSGSGGFDGSGVKVMLEGIDLSGNGFCFKGENLLTHVRWFRKLKQFSDTTDFKDWLYKYEAFNLIKRYILEKDQRWISNDELSKHKY